MSDFALAGVSGRGRLDSLCEIAKESSDHDDWFLQPLHGRQLHDHGNREVTGGEHGETEELAIESPALI